ncbi:MAG: Maf family protein [Planctomycetota bacterium]|nr:Maf family protein [Planctomycetota bacterium]MDA0933357.1 Maf family protein [Planctomycetota bacterium]
MTLYLASTSPRRSALLGDAGIVFVPVEPGVEPSEPGLPTDVALQRAVAKASAASIPAGSTSGLVLGVDTVVDLDGVELGKPRDADHARAMLAALAGRRHRVHTGLALVSWPERELVAAEVATAVVEFEALDEVALSAHVATGLHEGKAGAYGIQDAATARFARVLEGEVETVIGLPILRLRELLAEIGRDEGPR